MLLLQFSGLSGAGKTTIAHLLQDRLANSGILSKVIDGDVYRKTLCADLGFSTADRIENIRRLGAEAWREVQSGHVAIISAINPFAAVRAELCQKYNARTIWIDCPLEELIRRDTKGLYARALLPEGHPDRLSNLSGMGHDFEPPLDAHLQVPTAFQTPSESADMLLAFTRAQPELAASVRVAGTL